MGNYLGDISGYRVYEDPNIQPVLKYPAGYKDGNKLGRRKREMTYLPVMISGSACIMHPSQAKALRDLPKKTLMPFGGGQPSPTITREQAQKVHDDALEMWGQNLRKWGFFDDDKDTGFGSPWAGVTVPKA